MDITFITYLIVCPLVFLAGLVDSIGGGGGLISLPAYIFAGLPAHMAVATNKLSSSLGTTVSVIRFVKNKLIDIRLAIPSALAAIIGSSLGAKLSLVINEKIFTYILIAVLPLTAFVVLSKKLFHDNENDKITLDKKTYITALLSAFFIGGYDGLYGPGTGTFLIIAFTVFADMSIKTANAQAKVINLSSNIAACVVYMINGKVIVALGIAAALCNMLGNYIGSGLAVKNGSKITKPVIILVLILLLLKITIG